MNLFRWRKPSAKPEEQPEHSLVKPSSSFLGNISSEVNAALENEKNDPQYFLPHLAHLSTEEFCRFMTQMRKKINIATIIHAIGKGGFGTVFVGKENYIEPEDKPKYGLKLVSAKNLGPNTLTAWYKEAKNELYLLAKLRHPHIAKLYASMFYSNETSGARPHYLVMKMELLQKSLKDVLKDGPLTPCLLNKLVFQIGHAIVYMHESGVAHHDLKPRNLMLRLPPNFELLPDKYLQSELVLVDFGLSKEYAKCNTQPIDITKVVENKHRGGTFEFFSPEKLTPGKPYNPFSADCYALGVIILVCMLGKWLPNAQQVNHYAIAQNLLATQVAKREPVHGVLLNFLKPEKERFTMREILKIMWSGVADKDRVRMKHIFKLIDWPL